MICDFLRNALRNYSCKIKKNYLAFLQYRLVRMEQIKENIAILTVKKIWRARKWSFKIVKEKFIRIKRRKAAMQNKEAYQKYLATLGGPAPAAKKEPAKKLVESNSKDSKTMEEKNPDENAEGEKNPEEDEEFKEAQRIKNMIERKLKDRILKGKLAYAIEMKKDKMVLPMMQERALNENIDDPEEVNSKLLYITTSVFAKGRSLSRESRPKTRNFHISSPQQLSQRRRFDFTNTLPKLSLMSPANIEAEKWVPCNLPEVENESFLQATISSTNKTGDAIIPSWKIRYHADTPKKTKRIKLNVRDNDGEAVTVRKIGMKERANHWVPVARRFSTYVPGLENSAYQPYVWAPLVLDKRILHSAIMTSTTRTKKNSMSPSTANTFRPDTQALPSRIHSKRIAHDSISPSTQDPSIDFMNF